MDLFVSWFTAKIHLCGSFWSSHHRGRAKRGRDSPGFRVGSALALCLIAVEEFAEVLDKAEENDDRRPGDPNQESRFEQTHGEC